MRLPIGLKKWHNTKNETQQTHEYRICAPLQYISVIRSRSGYGYIENQKYGIYTYFEGTSIYGILVLTTKSKETHTKTNDSYILLKLRKICPNDELPYYSSRYLEPSEYDDNSQNVTQCKIDIWRT